jgi:hypothetical protein
MRIYGINSPGYEENEDQNWPLNWSKPPFVNMSHDGLPEVWTFKSWVGEDNKGFDFCGSFAKRDDCTTVNFCGWCGKTNKCVPGDEHGPYFGEKCSSGWDSLGKTVNVGLIVGLTVAGFVVVVVIFVVVIVLWRRKRHA